jgi:thiaminase/transcriptional activator TenA
VATPHAVTAPFTDTLWSGVEDIYASVLAHPFLTGLLDGTLPRESFRHYIVQDAHYLSGYAKVLALCAATATRDEDTAMFARHAANTVAVERGLHESLLAELGTTPEQAAAEPVSPTTRAYLDFLFASARGGYAEAVGAVLPCYWIYARVGSVLRVQGSPDPLYDRWINAYGDTAFQGLVDEVLAATDWLGERLSPDDRLLVGARMRTAARYEWMFWDAGYRRESWPV